MMLNFCQFQKSNRSDKYKRVRIYECPLVKFCVSLACHKRRLVPPHSADDRLSLIPWPLSAVRWRCANMADQKCEDSVRLKTVGIQALTIAVFFSFSCRKTSFFNKVNRSHVGRRVTWRKLGVKLVKAHSRIVPEPTQGAAILPMVHIYIIKKR